MVELSKRNAPASARRPRDVAGGFVSERFSKATVANACFAAANQFETQAEDSIPSLVRVSCRIHYHGQWKKMRASTMTTHWLVHGASLIVPAKVEGVWLLPKAN
jgi:hypothetical protein